MIQPSRRAKAPSKFPIRLTPKPKVLPGSFSEPTLTRFAGIGPFHSLLIPGLVPDGLETFHRVRKHFQGKGEVSVLTYPYEGFGLEALFAKIEQFLSDCDRRKKRPVLVGVSVGGGFVLEFLRRQKLAGKEHELAGLVLVSPMASAQDLAPILRRLWLPIVADEPTADQALEKGRSFFRQLAAKSAPAKRGAQTGWMRFFAAFTPQGLNELLETPLRRRIDRTLNAIPAQGAILRCRLLKELHGLEKGGPASVLTRKPTLILWGSKERHTLDVDGPGVGVLCRPDLAEKHFPDCQVQWIYSGAGEPVPHASLLKHDKAFARPIKEFLARI